MLVWRLRGKIIRTAPCCVVYDSCVQHYAPKCQQLLNFLCRLDLESVFLCLFSLGFPFLYIFVFASFCVFAFCCSVLDSVFSVPAKRLAGRTSPK